MLGRRDFLKAGCACAAAFACPGLAGPSSAQAAPADVAFSHEAAHYERLADGTVRCLLCPNGCVRGEGQRTRCRAREPRGGKLYTLVYGLPCVLQLDRVEKCPLYHVRLDAKVFSLATAGCNLGCEYCQNWEFSQVGPEATRNFRLTAAEVVAKAKERGCPAVAFFYTEPTVYFEYMRDVAVAAKEGGLKTIMVTAGYVNPAPLREACGWIDAFAVGLKGFTEDYYREVVHGRLTPVLRTLEALRAAGRWFEVVSLLVPGQNDAPADVARMVGWLRERLGPDTPLHFTRFRPQYKLQQLPLTPVRTLEAARAAGLAAGLRYVYVGNVPAHEGNHTYCPSCRRAVLSRLGFEVVERALDDEGRCQGCGAPVPGLWR